MSHAAPDVSPSRSPPDVCVAAVLGDALRRVAVLGGREGIAVHVAARWSHTLGQAQRLLQVACFFGKGNMRRRQDKYAAGNGHQHAQMQKVKCDGQSTHNHH